MSWWEYLLWGAVGGALIEGLDFAFEIKDGGDWPWKQKHFRRKPYLVAILIRVAVGAVLAVGLGVSGQLQTPAAAIIAGVSAPLIIERIGGRSRTEGTNGPSESDASQINGAAADDRAVDQTAEPVGMDDEPVCEKDGES